MSSNVCVCPTDHTKNQVIYFIIEQCLTEKYLFEDSLV